MCTTIGLIYFAWIMLGTMCAIGTLGILQVSFKPTNLSINIIIGCGLLGIMIIPTGPAGIIGFFVAVYVTKPHRDQKHLLT